MYCGSGPPFQWYGGGGPQPHGGAPLRSSHQSCLLLAHHGPLSHLGPPPRPLPLLPLSHHGRHQSSPPCPGFSGTGAAGAADVTGAAPTAEPMASPLAITAVAVNSAILRSFIVVTPTRDHRRRIPRDDFPC